MSDSKPIITFHYCSQCNWMLRTTWMVQEALSTFHECIGEVRLIPGTGGVFEIHVQDVLIWERKRDGGFPSAKTLKQRIRDVIDPNLDLGHIDKTSV